MGRRSFLLVHYNYANWSMMTFVWVQMSTRALKRRTRLFWDWTLTFSVGRTVIVSVRLIWSASIVSVRWGLGWLELPWWVVRYFFWYVLNSDIEGYCQMPWLADKQLKQILLVVSNFFLSDVVINLYRARCHIEFVTKAFEGRLGRCCISTPI